MIVNGFTAVSGTSLRLRGVFKIPHHLNHPDNISSDGVGEYKLAYSLGAMMPSVMGVDVEADHPHYVYMYSGTSCAWSFIVKPPAADTLLVVDSATDYLRSDFGSTLAHTIIQGLGIPHNPSGSAHILTTNIVATDDELGYTHICVNTDTDAIIEYKNMNELIDSGLAEVSSDGSKSFCKNVEYIISYMCVELLGGQQVTLIRLNWESGSKHLDKLLPGAIVKNSSDDLTQLEDLDVGKWVLVKHHYPESGDYLLAFRIIDGWSGSKARDGIVDVINSLNTINPAIYAPLSRRG